jgi:hypothetical protein
MDFQNRIAGEWTQPRWGTTPGGCTPASMGVLMKARGPVELVIPDARTGSGYSVVAFPGVPIR